MSASKLAREPQCVAVVERLARLLDSNGWDATDLASKLGVTIPRARFLMEREVPDEAEYSRIVLLLERHGI